ncbi:bifunctional protein-serine/threonine kinase/phosphatase [Microbulbifer sp.]|uniref:bifunctional protein-serine/threonine kinase/phosphatase n=1 Tax=Microbulbifer sp. TaxID=1908541 RepID=UPI00258DF2C2|nr:bifunctional protein-serine/threonine kinase/phosphatase [Microbulbifer sp.]
MKTSLTLKLGQYSDAGRKPENQDCFGACIPIASQLKIKGAVFAVADGISSSSVSQIASETAVKSFLEDYYCTSDAWSVRHSAQQVLRATNAWLQAQTRHSPYRLDKDKGYVCTFSALVLRSREAHLFHIGDSRIYRLRDGSLEQLTHDHRQWMGEQNSYLSRALGAETELEVDYRVLATEPGDLFLLTTDGIHEPLRQQTIIELLSLPTNDLDQAAQQLAQAALAAGSADNLTAQLIRIDGLPESVDHIMQQQVETLPLPPLLGAGEHFDGFVIERSLHASSRSHVYLATDQQSGKRAVLKMPSTELCGDPAYLEALLMEEWVARRVSNPHVIRVMDCQRPRNFLYAATEYIDGQTLRQWLHDNPKPTLEAVRKIIEQVARGLQALHRSEILHQDLRPENILIDQAGTVTLIDLGAARVAGIHAGLNDNTAALPPGTALYSAPEYFLGETGSTYSDLFSLAVLTYHLLSGEFPYGLQVARCNTIAAQHKLRYRSLLTETREIPTWVDAALKKALRPNPHRRYQEISEFITDLRRPNLDYLNSTRPPIIDRHPVRFWQSVSGGLMLLVIYLLTRLAS